MCRVVAGRRVLGASGGPFVYAIKHPFYFTTSTGNLHPTSKMEFTAKIPTSNDFIPLQEGGEITTNLSQALKKLQDKPNTQKQGRRNYNKSNIPEHLSLKKYKLDKEKFCFKKPNLKTSCNHDNKNPTLNNPNEKGPAKSTNNSNAKTENHNKNNKQSDSLPDILSDTESDADEAKTIKLSSNTSHIETNTEHEKMHQTKIFQTQQEIIDEYVVENISTIYLIPCNENNSFEKITPEEINYQCHAIGINNYSFIYLIRGGLALTVTSYDDADFIINTEEFCGRQIWAIAAEKLWSNSRDILQENANTAFQMQTTDKSAYQSTNRREASTEKSQPTAMEKHPHVRSRSKEHGNAESQQPSALGTVTKQSDDDESHTPRKSTELNILAGSNTENNNTNVVYKQHFPMLEKPMDSTVCNKRKANEKKESNAKICIKEIYNKEINAEKTGGLPEQIFNAKKGQNHLPSNNPVDSINRNTPDVEMYNNENDCGSVKTNENKSKNKNIKEQYATILQPTEVGRKIRFLNNIHILKDLAKAAGCESEVMRIHHLKKGGLLVQTATKSALEGILQMKTLAGITVYNMPPNYNASCKGVIRNIHPEITAEEIVTHLKASNTPILTAKKLENAKKIETMAVLTFPGATLPQSITFQGAIHAIEPFIESPLICGNCFKFSHHKDVCRAKQMCLHCARTGHDHNHCRDRENNKKPKCVNCGGEHIALTFSCPARKVCVEILKYKTHNKISFQDAKAIIMPKGISYIEALRRVSVKSSNEATVMKNTFMPISRQQNYNKNYSYAAAAKTNLQKTEQSPNFITLKQNKFVNAKTSNMQTNRTHPNNTNLAQNTDTVLKSIFDILSNHFNQSNEHSPHSNSKFGQNNMVKYSRSHNARQT